MPGAVAAGRAISSSDVAPRSRQATPRHATPRHATPRHATPRHATPRVNRRAHLPQCSDSFYSELTGKAEEAMREKMSIKVAVMDSSEEDLEHTTPSTRPSRGTRSAECTSLTFQCRTLSSPVNAATASKWTTRRRRRWHRSMTRRSGRRCSPFTDGLQERSRAKNPLVSLSSVVITSILFAFVQYSENSIQKRFTSKNRDLSGSGVYDSERVGMLQERVAKNLLYDVLINDNFLRRWTTLACPGECGHLRDPDASGSDSFTPCTPACPFLRRMPWKAW